MRRRFHLDPMLSLVLESIGVGCRTSSSGPSLADHAGAVPSQERHSVGRRRAVDHDDRESSLGAAGPVSALTITAAALALAVVLRREQFFSPEYFWQNRLPRESLRQSLLVCTFGSAAAVFLACLTFLARTDEKAVARLRWVAARAALLVPLGFLPWLFAWNLYDGHDTAFLLVVLADALLLGVTVRRAIALGPCELERRFIRGLTENLGEWLAPLRRRATDISALAVVLATAGYIAFFAYNTVVWHRSVRSGFDLAIEDNILWNLLHGGPFFHASPVFGPVGSHFGRHATLISYFLLPVYALHQDAETLHVIQAALLGGAALPLFLFARRRIGNVSAAVVALVYLLHPAVQESNLFEMQYMKVAPVFFWATLWLLDSGRLRSGVAVAALTLLVREDVASWVLLLGVFIAFSNELPVTRSAGALLAVVAGTYLFVVKFVIMPRFLEEGFDLVFMYKDLLPEGRRSFGWVLASVLSNPVYALESMLDVGKLVYVLQLLVPLALVPMRSTLGLFALVPGFVYCLLSTKYGPLIDIHYQYSPHVLSFEFPAAVLVLERLAGTRREGWAGNRAALIGALCTIVAAAVPCSYQYGAVFQQHTSRGGPVPFKFGWDEDGRSRNAAIRTLKDVVPASARVTASAFTVPQFSSRPNDYSLSLGVYDADWLVAPTRAVEYVGDELGRVRDELASGRFGVVVVQGPFFAARRGGPTARNSEVLEGI